MAKFENPNSMWNRMKRGLVSRWLGEDYPGAVPRFFWQKLAKDLLVFIVLPVSTLILYRVLDGEPKRPNRSNFQQIKRDQFLNESSKSQIIDFGAGKVSQKYQSGTASGAPRRAPGTLVKLKLQNVVETYSTAPVHAQILDLSLGKGLIGGSVIGDATPDPTYERISISFRFVRDPSREGVGFTVNARALSLDGTLGLIANKKEGFTSRSVFGSAATSSQDIQRSTSGSDFRDILLRALTSGLFQEMNTGTQVEKNRGQVLTLAPGTEFFAELTDYFPGGANK
jgi:hypothetical protein